MPDGALAPLKSRNSIGILSYKATIIIVMIIPFALELSDWYLKR
jgi:hypothetical protein